MIEEILRKIGVEKKETQVYLELLQSGPSSVSFLSKKSNSTRPTLYNRLEALAEKGIVYRAEQENGRIYIAETPEKILQIFEKHISRLRQAQENFKKITPTLNAKKGADFLKPRMQFFEGMESVQNAMEDFLSYRDIESLNFWTPKVVDLLSTDHFMYSNRKRIQNNIWQKTIAAGFENFKVKDYPNAATGKKFKRELRVAPHYIAPAMSYWVYANKVLFLASRAEVYAYIVESCEMAELMTIQFETLWDLSLPYKMTLGEDLELEEFLRDRF